MIETGSQVLGAARLFTSHSQFVLCDDPDFLTDDGENWDDEATRLNFAGSPRSRLIGTLSDWWDYWFELELASNPPPFDIWEHVSCAGFQCTTGFVHLMSVMDGEPAITGVIETGQYGAYTCVSNIGVESADECLTDDKLRYRIILVPGVPEQVGVLSGAMRR